MARRSFIRLGTATALSGVAVAGCAATAAKKATSTASTAASAKTPAKGAPESGLKPQVKRYRTLGRTGFSVSDIGMGCGVISDANVVRYAADRGVNFFDTAEGYGAGDSEQKIGTALAHLRRKEVFIVTKLQVKKDENSPSILDRFAKCQARLKTPYLDALYLHSCTEVALIKHPGFHEAVGQLKQAGRLRFAGVSSHGPRGKHGDSMDKVLLAAAEDGRFDVMLFTYSFMNREPGERVLKACKQKNIGTTLMKTAPGKLEVPTFDPDNPTERQARYLAIAIKRGKSREEAVAGLNKYYAWQRAQMDKHRPELDVFCKEHGIKTQEALKAKSIQWAMQNSLAHTTCVSMADFEAVDTAVPLSGATLSRGDRRLLQTYARAFSAEYCRHGCAQCSGRCPRDVPVSTIMRYVTYFELHGREKLAMQKYAALPGRGAAPCAACEAPCLGACPHGVDIQARLVDAHHLLSLA